MRCHANTHCLGVRLSMLCWFNKHACRVQLRKLKTRWFETLSTCSAAVPPHFHLWLLGRIKRHLLSSHDWINGLAQGAQQTGFKRIACRDSPMPHPACLHRTVVPHDGPMEGQSLWSSASITLGKARSCPCLFHFLRRHIGCRWTAQALQQQELMAVAASDAAKAGDAARAEELSVRQLLVDLRAQASRAQAEVGMMPPASCCSHSFVPIMPFLWPELMEHH